MSRIPVPSVQLKPFFVHSEQNLIQLWQFLYRGHDHWSCISAIEKCVLENKGLKICHFWNQFCSQCLLQDDSLWKSQELNPCWNLVWSVGLFLRRTNCRWQYNFVSFWNNIKLVLAKNQANSPKNKSIKSLSNSMH